MRDDASSDPRGPDDAAHALLEHNGSSESHEGEGEAPMPRTAERRATGRRTMRAWSAAQEEPKGPSLFARLGNLFRKKPNETAGVEEAAPEESAAPFDFDRIEALGEHAEHAPETPVVEEPAASVTPPQDFNFPWSRLGAESPTSSGEVEQHAPHEEPPSSPEPPPAEPVAPVVHHPSIEAKGVKVVGGRYELDFDEDEPDESIDQDFSRSKPAELTPIEDGAGSSHAELDDALTSAHDMAQDAPVEASAEATEPKAGFFERLFGRKRKSDETPIEELVGPVDAAPVEEASVEFAEEPLAQQLEAQAEPDTTQDEPAPGDIDERYEAALRGLRQSMEVTAASVPEVLEEEPALDTSASSEEVFEAVADEPIVEEAPKPGFFARLFGRKTPSQPEVVAAEEESTEVVAAEEESAEVVVAEEESTAFAEGVAFAAPAAEQTLEFVEGAPFVAPAEEEQPAEEPAPAFDPESTQGFEEAPLAQAFDPEATLDPDAGPTFDPDATLDPDAAPAAPAEAFDGDATFDPDTTLDPAVVAATEQYAESIGQGGDAGSTAEMAPVEPEVERPTVVAEAQPDEDPGSTGEMPEKAGFFARLFGREKDKTGEMVPVPADDGEVSFLISKYRAFYTEIIRAQEQKAKLTAGFSTAIMSEAQAADETTPENAAIELGWRFQQILELQTAEANWMRGEAQEKYPEAQYAMVALADELFSWVEWTGQEAWPRHGLEAKLFHSYSAHVEFFNRIDKLLRDPAPTKGTKDIARIYLMVLASGFEGMYREPQLKRPLAEYRRRLYEFVHGKFALDIFEAERKLVPQTMTNLLAGKAVGRFTSAQRWTAVLIILIAAYTYVAHLTWNTMTADLKDVTARIEAITSSPGGK